jgi:hypothetical protein
VRLPATIALQPQPQRHSRWSGTKWLYPQSHLLRSELQEVALPYESSQEAYARSFDCLEYLIALVQTDSKYRGPAAGEFINSSRWHLGDDRGLGQRVRAESPPPGPLLLGGAFDGDSAKATAAADLLYERMPHMTRF